MRLIPVCAIGGMLASWTMAGALSEPKTGVLPPQSPLPDPLVFFDGRRVSQADWPARRAELLESFQTIEYGHLPPVGDPVKAGVLWSRSSREGHPAVHTQYKIFCGPDHRISFVLDLTVPRGKGPFPVILTGDACWGRLADEVQQLFLERGYALAEFNRCEIAPDAAEQTIGLHVSYPKAQFGCLAAWVWGYHRAVDFLVTHPLIDPSKIVISGHSRGGKCVLLAGATDERVALVNPNDSGCAGTSLFRNMPPHFEDLKAITAHFPYWFTPSFAANAGQETNLPFDQHELQACVAPRAVLDTQALADIYSSPASAFRAHEAARKVYDFLGVPGRIAFHFRPGPHAHQTDDWKALADFADEIFFNKKAPEDWNAPPPTTAGVGSRR